MLVAAVWPKRLFFLQNYKYIDVCVCVCIGVCECACNECSNVGLAGSPRAGRSAALGRSKTNSI